MAKVQFFCNNGANIHSCRKSGVLDTIQDLGLAEGEWENLSDTEKWRYAEEWAANYLEIYYEEI